MPDTPEIHRFVVLLVLGLAVATFLGLLLVVAPYGRHMRRGWGPTVPSRAGWIVMESPAVLVFVGIFAMGRFRAETVPLLLLLLWQSHYVYRTFVFPFKMRAAGKRIPLAIVLLAILFNCLNAYINARWISHFGEYSMGWLRDPRLVAGVALFFTGMAVNRRADNVLLRLRRPGETGYRIPEGGLYRFVSCPNYLGEILEWLGWAVATWSLAGLAFAVYTAANIGPRAVSNHRWYNKQFPEYPTERRALIPYLL
jgi:steroid 5-alpha-reductase/3-oxo-5-alpha-steroid 4-dehydrogenase 1